MDDEGFMSLLNKIMGELSTLTLYSTTTLNTNEYTNINNPMKVSK